MPRGGGRLGTMVGAGRHSGPTKVSELPSNGCQWIGIFPCPSPSQQLTSKRTNLLRFQAFRA
jgi:hypothetical protein